MSDDRRPTLDNKASQETFVSLLQLEPMPMPDSAAPAGSPIAGATADKALPPLPAEGEGDGDAERSLQSAATTSALGLSGGHGHGAIYYLSRIQRYSSYAFTIFTSVHLATTSLIPLATRSVPASESYLLLAREIYQTRVSEPLLVAVPVVVHVAAGVGLRLVRRSHNLRRYGGATPGLYPVGASKAETERGRSRRRPEAAPGVVETLFSPLRAAARRLVSGWPALNRIGAAGYVFFAALAAHVAVNRLLPLAVEGDSSDIGLAYIAHGFARHPATAWVSYAVFLGAASGHMVWGWARWLHVAERASWDSKATTVQDNTARRRRRRRTWLLVQGGVLLTFGAWAAGGLGVVARGGPAQGWVAEVYDGLYDKLLL